MGGGHQPPATVRPLGGLDRRRHVLGVAALEHADHLIGMGGVPALEGPSRTRRYPFAVYVVEVCLRHRPSPRLALSAAPSGRDATALTPHASTSVARGWSRKQTEPPAPQRAPS